MHFKISNHQSIWILPSVPWHLAAWQIGRLADWQIGRDTTHQSIPGMRARGSDHGKSQGCSRVVLGVDPLSEQQSLAKQEYPWARGSGSRGRILRARYVVSMRECGLCE
jgi:hypothetical protein